MKLYTGQTSPYGRMAQIVILEKGLENRVEIIAPRTRLADSPYYAINPSGRVPYLVCDDGTGLEESQLICAYLDHLDGAPAFERPVGAEGWEVWRLEAMARGLMDGVSVWTRERRRPEEDQSAAIMEHERQRAGRLTTALEEEVESPHLRGAFRNMAQLSLIVALQLDLRNSGFVWRDRCPRLAAWLSGFEDRPPIAETVPLVSV